MSARYLGDVILSRVRGHADKTYKAGESYEVACRKFHTTEIDGLAVTVVHRCHFDDRPARVLSNSDVTVSGIVRDDSAEHDALVEEVLCEAAAAVAQIQ